MSQPHWNNNQFNAPVDSSATLTNASVRAAPQAGMCIYITDVIVFAGSGTSKPYSFLQGSGGAVLFTIQPATGLSQVINFKTPLKLTPATALCTTATGASTGANMIVSGFIGRDQ